MAGLAGLMGLAVTGYSQSSDALLNKLVEKGILTANEASSLKDEASKDLNQAIHKNSGLPDYVKDLRFSGDFRGRFEKHAVDNSLYSDRNRLRYRLRFGVKADIYDDFEVGFRLSSGDPNAAFGGNPVSANTTLGDGASRKFVWIDTAYVKWNAIHNGDWKLTGTFGKMENPFALSPMVFDPDYNPEGFALQGAYNINDKHALKFAGGFFVLDEFNQGAAASHDPYMMGAQLALDSKWTDTFNTDLSIAALNITSKGNLLNGSAPNANNGNTRTAAGAPAFNFNPIVAGASATYKLDSFPMYKGHFPVKVGGEYMYNPAAPTDNHGYWGGITLGKAGKKGLWELSYKYQVLQGDAWYEELVDDDNGGFYSSTVGLNSGNGTGFYGGTNVKGHVMKLTYNLTDSLNLAVTYYLTSLIKEPTPVAGTSAKSDAGHLTVDLMWKF